MQYFIPAWYSNNDWKENEQVWYRSRTETEFDDTVKQIQLFFRKKVSPFQILLLGFSPNFRHFLHRQGVYHAPYISCFDAMQGVTTQTMQMFSFHDLAWPEDVSFIYSPFAVVVMQKDQKYAQIEFGQDGNMFRVDIFDHDTIVCTNIYDDRKFLSCQIMYKNGAPFREQYFNEEGIWKFARYLNDGHVRVNQDSNFYMIPTNNGYQKLTYQKERYEKIDDMIVEVMNEIIAQTSGEDNFIVAMHPLHTGVINNVLEGKDVIVSLFEKRFEKQQWSNEDIVLMQRAKTIIADRQITAKNVQQVLDTQKEIRVITPYDSRIEFGTSLHTPYQNILVAIDDVHENVFEQMIVNLAHYIMSDNKQARVHLFTRSAQYSEKMKITKQVEDICQKYHLPAALINHDGGVAENGVDEMNTVNAIFYVSQCMDEMAVSRTLKQQRLIIDLQAKPDQFLQISAMSIGIPQITAIETDYVIDGQNGFVIHDTNQLVPSVHYYLSSIEHFNEAQIASYDIGSQYTTDKLVQAWKEVI